MTFPPGALSTWKPPSAAAYAEGIDFAVGDVWMDPIGLLGGGNTGILAPLTINDLACPTWGLGRSTSADGTVITTIGPPWLPLIAPPMAAFSLDPTWALLCTGMLTDEFALSTFALFDPPVALTRGSGLVPAPLVPVVVPTSLPAPNHADPTTLPDVQVAPSTGAAKPASSPVNPAVPPARTGDPLGDSPSPSLAIASADPTRPGSPAGDPQTAPADPEAPTQPVPQQGGDSHPQTQGLGAIIYNAFGKSGPGTGGIENKVNTITVPTSGVQEIDIGGDQVLSVDPSGVQFEGKSYSIGGPAMTLSDNVYTLVPPNWSENTALNDDDSPIDSPPPAPDTLTLAGQTIVPNPTGMIIAGSSVVPGGSAVTISNTPVSLDPSGILVVGSSSFSLPPQSIFTIGTQTFTTNPTGFVLNGAAISPGAAAQTIDGTMISLGYFGALTVGSSTILLQTPSRTPTATAPVTVAGQTFTPNPTAFSIAGTTISVGGPAVTIAGTIISLQPSGTLIVGSSTIPLLATSTPPPENVLSIAGQTFTPNPTAFSIAGTKISAGGPAVTVDGTMISLQPSGTLIVGSSTIPLLPSSSSLLNIDRLSVEAQSSFAIVDGVTISSGAPGVTIDGSVVSLEAGGATLDVGTGHFAMPTGVSNGSNGLLAFEGGQGREVEVPLLFLLSLVGIGGILELMV